MSRAPVSTYRLQLRAGQGFAFAAGLVDYLDALGVTHVYASPYLRAEPGSTHGYNMVDPTMLNPELGTVDDYRAWTDALRAKGMGHIVDIVPNHMGIATSMNRWWQDVLENGPASLYADYFDIEWDPPKHGLRDRVLLPILGAQYGEVLENGELRLVREGGAFFVEYWERRLPVAPRSLIGLLERVHARLALSSEDLRSMELESILTSLRHLPNRTEKTPEARVERAREKEVIKRRLGALCEGAAEIRDAVDAVVADTNGKPKDPKSFDALDALLREQTYRLAFWRVATEEINYRRFFDINDLAAVRMECEAVFDETHALVFRLIEEGRLDGLRLDHTDGLYDPAEYFAKLQARAHPREPLPGERPLYVVAEKILEPGERLPTSWRIHGTTGYEFIGALDGLWIDPSSERRMTELYREVTGDQATFAEHALVAKRAIMRASLSSEVNMLAQMLERIAEADRRSRDFTRASLTAAIIETIAAFPVYRTYIRPDGSREPNDTQHIDRAIRHAKRRNPEMSASIFEFLRDVLLLRIAPGAPDADRATCARFVMRFQQLTGPVMAKGVEDTAFYTYCRLASLNEVGGRPDRFGTPIAEFHQKNEERLASWPLSMTARSTHDTKRGEDVRARLAVLTEIPDLWRRHVEEWRRVAAQHVTTIEEDVAPSATDEYLFFQTVLGAFPLLRGGEADFAARIAEYMTKASREAKQRTAWLNPNEGYEAATRAFVSGMFGDEAFVSSVRALADRLAAYGASNGVAQVLLHIASPGVPDNYQGSEAYNLSLVDPDNRRPVDYAALCAMLTTLDERRATESGADFAAGLLERFRDGAIKVFVVREALRLRRAFPELFIEGEYRAIDAGEHVVAFARVHGERMVVCAVARHPYRLTEGARPWATGDAWGEASLPLPRAGRWSSALVGRALEVTDGARVRLAELFAELPVALLTFESSTALRGAA